MTTGTFKSLFNRDLKKLKEEIALYQDGKNIWLIENGISNSAGNLCLHLIGNLNAYTGVGLAKTNYVRQRDLEFSLKDIPREELLKKIDDTIIVVEAGLNQLQEDELNNDFPFVIWEQPTSVSYTLIRLLSHLNYHLGQINYHRRLMDNNE